MREWILAMLGISALLLIRNMAKIISQGCVYPLSLCEAEEINGFPGWFSQEFSKPAFELKAGASDSTYKTCEEIYESVKEAFTVFSLM